MSLLIGLSACSNAQVEDGKPTGASVPDAEDVVVRNFDLTDQALTDACTADRFSGIILAVSPRKTLYEFSFHGSATTDTAIDSGTNFKLFSTSKQFTAAVILQLIDEGRLWFETPIDSFFESAPDSWSGVTIGHLLVHTSGIPDLTNGLLEQFQTGLARHSEAVQATISEAGASADSGGAGAWTYNNFGYEMLAVIAEQAGRAPFDQLMQERIFDRAGMDHAVMEQLDEAAAELQAISDNRLVPGYNGEPGERVSALSYSFVQQGAGAVHASANDLVRYYRALSDGTILPSEMQARQRQYSIDLNEQTTVIPGWFVGENASHETWSHSGGNNGYISWFGMMPDQDVAIIMLSNYGDAPTRDLRNVLLADLFPDTPE